MDTLHSHPDSDPDANHDPKCHRDAYERGYHDGYRDGYTNANADALSGTKSHALAIISSMEARLHMQSPESELSDCGLVDGVDTSINDCWSHRRG